MKRILLLVLLLLVLLSGCTGKEEVDTSQYEEDAKKMCVTACFRSFADGIDLANGPCLGSVAEDWVCDVAHDPRKPVDDLEENQCEAYREGDAHHFVEVSLDCTVIRAV